MRVRMCAAIVVAVLLIPGVAHAKGPSAATIAGADLAAPVSLTGDEGTPGDLMTLADQAGLFPATFGQEPDPMLPKQPTTALGPKYTITWTMPSGDPVASTLHQDVYPFAAGGPFTYTEPGQPFFGTEHTRGGWYRGPSALTTTLTRLGVPSHPIPAAPPATAAPPVTALAAAPATARSRDSSSFPLVPVAVGAAAALLGGLGLAARRRGRMAPA